MWARDSGHRCVTHPLYSKKTQRNRRTRCCWSQSATGRCHSARPGWCWNEPAGGSASPRKTPSLLFPGCAAPGCSSPPHLWGPPAGRDPDMDCWDSDLSSGPATCHNDKNTQNTSLMYSTSSKKCLEFKKLGLRMRFTDHLVLHGIPRNKTGALACSRNTPKFTLSKCNSVEGKGKEREGREERRKKRREIWQWSSFVQLFSPHVHLPV